MSIVLIFQSTPIFGELACRAVETKEMAAIAFILTGLIAFAVTAAPGTIIAGGAGLTAKAAIPAVVTKILAGLTVGASASTLVVPLQGFLDISVVWAAVESIKAILGCG